MKIAICTSTSFDREARTVKRALARAGHHVIDPLAAEEWNDHRDERAGESAHEFTREYEIIRAHYEHLMRAEALLVLNYDKYGTPGYIGGGMLMDMGFAHALGKSIYLFNPVPRLPYKDEIEITRPIVLNGDLSNLSLAKSVKKQAQRRIPASRVRTGKTKRVTTFDAQGRENGFLMELLKEGRTTRVYMTAVKPGAFKGYHLHRVMETNYVAVRGCMRVMLYVRKGKTWKREEHMLDAAKADSLHIPVNVATGFSSATNEESWLINFPQPPYDPDLKDEQVEYTEDELKRGVVK